MQIQEIYPVMEEAGLDHAAAVDGGIPSQCHYQRLGGSWRGTCGRRLRFIRGRYRSASAHWTGSARRRGSVTLPPGGTYGRGSVSRRRLVRQPP